MKIARENKELVELEIVDLCKRKHTIYLKHVTKLNYEVSTGTYSIHVINNRAVEYMRVTKEDWYKIKELLEESKYMKQKDDSYTYYYDDTKED